MVKIALLIVVAELGFAPNEAIFFDGITPPITSSAPDNGKFTRFDGMDKTVLVAHARNLAAKYNGAKDVVLKELKELSRTKLNITPPFKDAEIAEITNVVEDACKPYVKPQAPPPPPPLKRYSPAKPTDRPVYYYQAAPQYYYGGCQGGNCPR